MSKKYLFKLSACIFLAVIFLSGTLTVSAADSVQSSQLNVDLQLIGTCNSNGTCEQILFEDEDSCSSDCGCNSNNTCESARGEDETSCPSDCICNHNNTCELNFGEDPLNCSSDCGCDNNGTCDTGRQETSQNCPNDCPIPEPDLSGGGIYGFYIDLKASQISFESAKIIWTTNRTAKCLFYLDGNFPYRAEIFSGDNYSTYHYVALSGLMPGSVYNYDITCTSSFGDRASKDGQSFTTLSLPEAIYTANVTNLRLAQIGENLKLSWKNPADRNFKGVKIFRSETYFPLFAGDGELIYNGPLNYYSDADVEIQKIYYYTVFAYDTLNNYSSGAIVAGLLQGAYIPPVAPPVSGTLKLQDFDFYFDGKKVVPLNDTLTSTTDQKIHVSINSNKIPDSVKVIIITLQKGEESSSYLFSRQRESFFADFIAPENSGEYSLTINLWGYDNKIIQSITGKLVVVKLAAPKIFCSWILWIILIILIILLIILRRFIHRFDKN